MNYKYNVISFDENGVEKLQGWTGSINTKKGIDEWFDRFGRHHEAQGHELVRLSKRKNGIWKIDGENIAPEEFLNNRKKRKQMKINLEIAKICHQVNRDYCINEQLEAPPKWDDLPEYVQESIVAGVAEVIADPKVTPTQIHQMWCDYKEKEGWKYALNKDLELKTHPNLVPFKDLDDLEKRKDVLFIRTVKREMKK